ncbi:hypothetical protein GZ78_18015 [Endozoicomonas numazuensis]|uniref:Multidrug resistance protein MdtA-like barrel-sandwich hybrid domain-containing protein n=1 Tax=Endozoicomonas numazuensis TaxID=1137799 RepID=A0A081NGQ1_9GAMM|nr:hypothetical protein GZ78_18015 [Endozoicomonas numazuensis]
MGLACLLSFNSFKALAVSTVSYAEVSEESRAPLNWYNGSVASQQKAELSAEISGRIIWLADFGQRVEAGDVVARIDDRQLQLQLKTSAVVLGKAKSILNYLKTELDRLESLHKKRGISRTELDKARHDYDLARLDVDYEQVNHEIIRDQLSRTVIKAPFSGVVNQRTRQPNEHISSGSPVLHLVNPDALDIRVQIPIELAATLESKSSLKVQMDEQHQQAEVFQRGAKADAQSRLVEVRLDPESDHWLPGSPVKVAIPMSALAQVKVVPRDAVILSAAGSAVFKILENPEGGLTVKRVSVEVLFGDDDSVSVKGDIQQGDRVVVRGASRLRDSEQVVLLEESIPVS